MCSDHYTSVPVMSATSRSGVRSRAKKSLLECKSVESQSVDLEKEGMVMPTSFHSPTLDLSHYRMADGMFIFRSRISLVSNHFSNSETYSGAKGSCEVSHGFYLQVGMLIARSLQKCGTFAL